ncbi:MAG: hypothetical protein ABI837_15130 [Acidobacteriota bacterium]
MSRLRLASRTVSLIGAAVILMLAVLVFIVLRRGDRGTVVGHAWWRQTRIERLVPHTRSIPCSKLSPAEAKGAKRRRVMMGRNLPYGKDCTHRGLTQEGLTRKQTEECRPGSGEAFFWEEVCDQTVAQWDEVRTINASGRGLAPAMSWTQVRLQMGIGEGTERRKLFETYSVTISVDEREYSCPVSEEVWRSLHDRSVVRVEFSDFKPVCSSLRPSLF